MGEKCKITRITFAVPKERSGGLVTAVMFVLNPAVPQAAGGSSEPGWRNDPRRGDRGYLIAHGIAFETPF